MTSPQENQCVVASKVWAHYLSRKGRKNVLIGLPDLVNERKLSKIVIKKDYQIFDIPICFCQRETFYNFFFKNLINSKLISELVSSDKTVFLFINATQV